MSFAQNLKKAIEDTEYFIKEIAKIDVVKI
jgi:hypothetical protein